jgi:hypothetical protein
MVEKLTDKVNAATGNRGASQMPVKYIEFTEGVNKACWMWTNLAIMAVSCIMTTGSFMVLRGNPIECAGIRLVTWFLTFLHIVNFLVSATCLCGLEKKYGRAWMLTAFVLFDGIILIWANVTYFKSQADNCIDNAASIYFWLMGEIMFFYVFTGLVVCYFFRKFC